MKFRTLCIALAVAGRPGRRRARGRAGKAHRLVGQGLLQGRGRRAVRGDQEVRGQEQERQGRAVAVPDPGHDPEDGGRARRRQPARRGLCRRLRLPGHRQVGLRRQARGHHQRHRPDAAPSSSRARCRPPSCTTTQAKKRAYYAFPIKQQTMHIQYWKDMLGEAGFKESDIPKDWKGYWSFWCDKVQPAYRQKTGKRGFGTGFPMGVDSSDSFYSFLTFMDAYNVKLVNDSGKLLVDDPTVRAGPDQRADRLHRRLHARAARRRRRRAGRTRTTTSPSTTRRS